MTGENLPIEAIRNAPVTKPPEEVQNPAKDPFTGKDLKLEQHLGVIGGLIGGGPEKAGNVAFSVIVVAVFLLILSIGLDAYTMNEKLIETFDKIVTGAIGLITGALGYLFGSADKHQP